MKKLISIILLIALVVFTGCQVQTPAQNQQTSEEDIQMMFEADGIQKFENFEEAKAFLEEMQGATSSNNGGFGRSTMMFETLSAESKAMADGAAAPMMDADESAGDYSETNVQVEGVDEADIVKNDGRYIYLISNNQLLIVDAYDAENAEIIYKESIGTNNYYLDPQAKELFIYDDKLILFVQENKQSYRFNKYDIRPMQSYKEYTKVIIYDMSDKKDLKVLEEFESSGYYYQSRMIKDKVYLITSENTGYYGGPIDQPVLWKGNTKIMPDIYYFPNPETNYNFNTITSIDADNQEVIDAKTYMLGYANTLMMSENNIYIAYQQNNWRYYWGTEYEKERFYDVVVPLLEGQLKTDINNAINRNLDEDKEWEEIENVLSEFFLKAEKDVALQDDYEEMFTKIGEALDEYDTKKELEMRKTIIHKINVDEGMLDYVAEGRVDGQLLNQFSMDEYEGNLRLATTVNIWTRQRIQYNNVYVLDENMKEIGSVEEIAEDERIYSTRFLGDKLYMVTFRQTDPFFVIDLSDPSNPEVLGELKIPGFSNYLHPYDENHIIGVGKETTEEKWGVTTKGVKVALFDVSDYSNPVLVDKVEIGDSGSDSPILYDHKAFLFSRSKDLLVLPVRRVTGEGNDYFNNRKVWYGAYAFKVTKDGFERIGTVEHDSSSTMYYWNSDAEVKRSIYMDDNLYTISGRYIKINDLSNGLEELNAIKLEGVTNDYPRLMPGEEPEPIPVDLVSSEGMGVDSIMVK